MSESLFISPVGLNGLPSRNPEAGTFTYLYGLSDFWVSYFEDTDLVEGFLESYTLQLGDIYGRFLQLAGNISLASIQETYNSQLALLRIGSDANVDAIHGVTYKLTTPIANVKYLMNRPILPTLTLVNGTHFELSEDGSQITFYRPLRDLAFPKRPRQDGVEEYAIWASDLEIDEGILYHQYGALVGMSPETAIGRYKDFLQGLYYLYSHGPTIEKIISGLNLALGLPSARSTEQVLTVVQNTDTGHWIVITPTQAYDIPYGFRPDLAEGDVIKAGQQLCSWVEIKDWQKDGSWWMYSHIPKELVQNTTLPVAIPGNVTDRIMQDYLKNHTFMVLLKQGGISLDAYSIVTDIVDRVKPSYTYPVYVWQAPLGEETVDLRDEDMSYLLNSNLEDVVGPGLAIDDFVRNDEHTQFFRGTHWYNRYQVPTYVQRMMGDLPVDGFVGGIMPDGTALSGIGGWSPEVEYTTELEQARFNACIRSRSDIVIPRTRSTAIRGWRGVDMGSEKGMTWRIKASDVYPANGNTYNINERKLVPLYACTEEELNIKMKTASVSFTTKTGGKIKALRNVAIRRYYEKIIKRNKLGVAMPAAEQQLGVGIEDVFHYELTNGGFDPALSKWASQAYVPSLKSLPDRADIIVAEIFRYTWAVYLVVKTALLAPTYFPVDNRDVIDMKIEWDYDQINEDRPAVIHRSSIGIEPGFLMDRSRADGAYDNGKDDYTLHMNRSGIYGPLDQPLISYKKV